METTYRMSLRIKGVEKEFKDGMGAGVICIQDVVIKPGPMASSSLLDAVDALMRAEVEVVVTEIPKKNSLLA